MKWLGRTVLAVVPVVLGVVLAVFFLLRIVPGDPATMILGDQATADSIEALREQLGLNLPLGQQLWNWLWGLFSRGDIGTSLVTAQPVGELVLGHLGITLGLVAVSFCFTILLTVPLALVAARNAGRWPDQLIRVVPTVGMAMPAFWVGLVLILIFGVRLHWFPVGGIGAGPGEPLRSLVLPALTVALGMSPPLIRSLREQLLEMLESEFVVTLRAARLPDWRINLHLLRNAAAPTVSLFGLNLAYLLGGTVVIERVFAINGLGALLFSSISTRDFPVVQGIALLLALVVVAVSLFTDVLVGLIDPRVRAR